MNLQNYGFTHYKTKLGAKLKDTDVARVIAEHKTDWDLITTTGKLKGIALTTWRNKLSPDLLPKVGDFVTYEKLPGENKAKITKVLPRFSTLSRVLTEQKSIQVLATNLDIAFIVLSLDQIINFNQLNRYLAAASSGKIEAIVVINKTDKPNEYGDLAKQLKDDHAKLKIIQTSAKTKMGLDQLLHAIQPNYTVAFVGNSGAGKSSLINLLLEYETQTTGSVREDGKGRHTTTRREMFVLPSGGIVIDTPGIRTVEFNSTEIEANEIFPKLEILATQCKFRNCDHQKSKGCALLTAVEKDEISMTQLRQFLRLYQNNNDDKEQRSVSLERKAKHKMIHKALKKHYANKK